MFERNLEKAQIEMGIDSQYHIPVLYKNEVEA